ncbi:MAG: amino acid synthesis family protein [Acidimicrobiales bacterium]
MEIRKFVTTCEDTLLEAGRPTGRVVRKAVCTAVVRNPAAGSYRDDLSELEALGAEVSGQLAERALAALGVEPSAVTAYGKAAIVGTDGELEHAAAVLHPRFGAPVRAAVGGGAEIIPSTKKVGAAGSSITFPLLQKDDRWQFDEMDAIEVCIGDAPRPDEMIISVGLAVGGRPLARTRKPS